MLFLRLGVSEKVGEIVVHLLEGDHVAPPKIAGLPRSGCKFGRFDYLCLSLLKFSMTRSYLSRV